MIDLSSLKTPGWQRVVAELTAAAADDRVFLARLLSILGQVSGAKQAVLFYVDRAEGESTAEPRAVLTWPPGPDAQAVGALESAADIRAAARAAVDSSQVRVFGTEQSTAFYEDQEKGSIIGVPVTNPADQAGPRGVVTLLIEPRSRQALQTTTAMVEVLAGYINLHAVRQQLLRVKAASAALDLAAKLIASINTATTFRGAMIQLVNDLSRQIRADRVAAGWVRGIGTGGSGAVRVVAISDTEHIDRRMAMVQKIEAAMDECLDQEQTVLYPPPPGHGEQAPGAQGAPAGDVMLAQAITHAHRELGASDARLKVLSLPLRDGDRIIGIITVESTAEGPADIGSIELVQAALDLVSPTLAIRRSDDRTVAVRAWVSTVKGGSWLVGPKHTVWKMVGVLLLIAGIVVTFVRVPYRVQAPMEIQARTKHTISLPFDGVIESLGPEVSPGRIVQKGDVLLVMDTMQAKLQSLEARSQMVQAEKEADGYRKAMKLGEAQQAVQRAKQAEARFDSAEENISRARITAPITGTIIAGDLQDRIGAAGKLGDAVFQIAPLNDMIVLARVSDRDIALIQDEVGGGPATRGYLATKAQPAESLPLIVERIVPLAQPKDGKNAFEVRCRIADDAKRTRALMPGMEGFVKLDTGRRTLLDIGTRRIRDQLRLWLWW